MTINFIESFSPFKLKPKALHEKLIELPHNGKCKCKQMFCYTIIMLLIRCLCWRFLLFSYEAIYSILENCLPICLCSKFNTMYHLHVQFLKHYNHSVSNHVKSRMNGRTTALMCKISIWKLHSPWATGKIKTYSLIDVFHPVLLYFDLWRFVLFHPDKSVESHHQFNVKARLFRGYFNSLLHSLQTCPFAFWLARGI